MDWNINCNMLLLIIILKFAESDSVWLEQKTPQGFMYYYNTESNENCWEKPEGFNSSALLTREEIQVSLSEL